MERCCLRRYRGRPSIHSLTAQRNTVQSSVLPAPPRVRARASPAIQDAFTTRWCQSIDTARIDSTYVVFPAIENRKSAGDSPSHFVCKFLTDGRWFSRLGTPSQLNKAQGTHVSEEHGHQLLLLSVSGGSCSAFNKPGIRTEHYGTRPSEKLASPLDHFHRRGARLASVKMLVDGPGHHTGH